VSDGDVICCFYVDQNAITEANLYLTTRQNLAPLNTETILYGLHLCLHVLCD